MTWRRPVQPQRDLWKIEQRGIKDRDQRHRQDHDTAGPGDTALDRS